MVVVCDSNVYRRPGDSSPSRYSSRLAYSRTSAVMCIVGYILGLGDRHGENILFDSTSGDCIHVDFNCLFNRVSARLSACLSARLHMVQPSECLSVFTCTDLSYPLPPSQGKTFDVPECVPFRLTHNLVKAMVSGWGISGHTH